ncbi:hypothetical protein [Thioclava pacifica]|uniref:hypothetical protein n=1 Tax=Thioclava pacifica TaxID=285109 RepID=UPI00056EA85C|nr:hypothetical protein [Thioclava pacifica]
MHKVKGEPTAVQPERKPVRVVICGEVSSGKSTVLNALLRERLVEDNLGRDQRPVVYANWRATPGRELRDADGQAVADADPEKCAEATELHLWSSALHLRGLELIEVPLTRAEDITDEQIALIGSADLMIWVTIASQAWRLTEKSLIEALGSARPENAILAISRADKLRSDADRTRLMARVERESADWFDRCLFVSGARARLGQALGSDEAFARTGGAALLEALRELGQVSDPAAENAADPDAPEASVAPRPTPAQPGPGGEVLRFPGGERARDVPPLAFDPETDPEPEITDAPGQGLGLPSDCTAPLAHDGLDAGVLAAGRIAFQAQQIDPLHGAPEQILRVGLASADLIAALRHTYGTRFGDDALSALNFTMGKGRLLARVLPQGDLIFALCDPKRLSEGAAMQVMGRLSKGVA